MDDLIMLSNEELSFSFPLKPQSTQINEPLEYDRLCSPMSHSTPQSRRISKENCRSISTQNIPIIKQRRGIFSSTFRSLTNVTPLARDITYDLSSNDHTLLFSTTPVKLQLQLNIDGDVNDRHRQQQRQSEQVQLSIMKMIEQKETFLSTPMDQQQVQLPNEDEVQETLEVKNKSSPSNLKEKIDDSLEPIDVEMDKSLLTEHVPYPPPLILYSQAIRKNNQKQLVRENTLTNTSLKSLPRKPANYSFVLSGLGESQRIKVQSLVRKMGDCYLQTYVELSTTHIIMNYDENKPPEEQITMEIILAMLYGCPIVTLDWIMRSVKVGEWLPCKKYEILSKKVQSVKTYKKARQNGERIILFQECGDIYLTSTTKYPRDDLLKMIVFSGGNTTICRNRAKVVVGKSSKSLKVIAYPNVKEEWVIDSIKEGKVLPYENYLLD
ncbi:unnamed protein product [Didymodactylos carnosus]|uniref:BRCT domain-containing protein n=1 Tax=Didymodactylos carnosus TaxID=1234261 RepID=A0A815RUZ7_9BILA|nr:unnamed protein product [Didymodactylos carnosus]CAF4346758.1 unnamed protein product [Didymodactylos carnosus]